MKRLLDLPQAIRFGAPARLHGPHEATYRVLFFAPGSLTEAAIGGLHAKDLAEATKRISQALKPGWSAEVWSHDAQILHVRLAQKH